jgi:ABC-type sugar transport system substrate-binding protein
VERVPEAGSSVEAAAALGVAAGAAVASGPPDMPPALAPAAAEAVAVLAVERPVAADAEMAEASLLGASEEEGAGPRPVLPSGSLVPTRRSSEGRRQLLRF